MSVDKPSRLQWVEQHRVREALCEAHDEMGSHFTRKIMESADSLPSKLLPLTEEEQSLLDLYKAVKSLEREANQVKADAAIARLLERDNIAPVETGHPKTSTFSSKTDIQPLKRKVDHKGQDPKEKLENGFSDDDENEGMKTISSTFHRNEEKLAMLRQEKDIVANRIEQQDANIKKEEILRLQLLKEDHADMTAGPSLKRKKLDDRKEQNLISNINIVSTPIHDFSKTLDLNKISGSVLFPPDTVSSLVGGAWIPPENVSLPEEKCLELDLHNFHASIASDGMIGNNTIAIKFMAPSDSKRFSLNVAAPAHQNYYNVLFHFNPRQFEKGGTLVLNDKQNGMWSQGVNIPLSRLPVIFGEASCTLIIQINGEGFDVFVNGKHSARLEHRTPLPDNIDRLILQFPSTDDYGERENWRVYKVWWGHKDIMANEEELSNIPGAHSNYTVHETKLFISGLPKLYSQSEVDIRRAELERAFRKYGGNEGVSVKCQMNSTFAFVEVDNEEAANLALKEMASKYRLNRGRKSRHETLTEQMINQV